MLKIMDTSTYFTVVFMEKRQDFEMLECDEKKVDQADKNLIINQLNNENEYNSNENEYLADDSNDEISEKLLMKSLILMII